MVAVKKTLGPTGRTAAPNIAARRRQLGLTYIALSRRLTHGGHDLSTLALKRIETGNRRIDVDDLMALAGALEVSPITLLMPPDATTHTPIQVTGQNPLPAKFVWNWLTASYPLMGEVMAFYNTLPAWERDNLEQRLGAVRP